MELIMPAIELLIAHLTINGRFELIPPQGTRLTELKTSYYVKLITGSIRR